MTTKKHAPVASRGEQFAERIKTAIWKESARPDNPYVAQTRHCYGYELNELLCNRDYPEVLFLILRGELPTPGQRRLFERLLTAFINPGPRHPATRAAMNAAVGRTSTSHILPIAMTVAGGAHLGGEEVTQAMRFLNTHADTSAATTAEQVLRDNPHTGPADWHPVPGFGNLFGSIDPVATETAELLLSIDTDEAHLRWGSEFVSGLSRSGLGWLAPGVIAATLLDLGFPPRAGAGIFQLISAPGLLAHGLELADKPITSMPFLDKDHYVISESAKHR